MSFSHIHIHIYIFFFVSYSFLFCRHKIIIWISAVSTLITFVSSLMNSSKGINARPGDFSNGLDV